MSTEMLYSLHQHHKNYLTFKILKKKRNNNNENHLLLSYRENCPEHQQNLKANTSTKQPATNTNSTLLSIENSQLFKKFNSYHQFLTPVYQDASINQSQGSVSEEWECQRCIHTCIYISHTSPESNLNKIKQRRSFYPNWQWVKN